MASSPTPSSSSASASASAVTYRPYVSHRRNASSLASSASITPAATPPPPSLAPSLEPHPTQQAESSQTTARRQQQPVLSSGQRASAAAPPPLRKVSVTPRLPEPGVASGPPPLRRVSALRAQEPLTKGKGRDGAAAKGEGGNAAPGSEAAHDTPLQNGEAGAAKGRALGAAAAASSASGKARPASTHRNGSAADASLHAHTASRGGQNPDKLGNAQPRPLAHVNHKSARSLASQNDLALPHQVSTAARLREHNRSPSSVSQSSILRTSVAANDVFGADQTLAAAEAVSLLELNSDTAFQPKGAERNRSQEFGALRRERKGRDASKELDLEGERMERRLEKVRGYCQCLHSLCYAG